MTKNPIKNPVIIIGCPRSGTTMLFTILSQSQELYSLYRESWNVFWGAYKKNMLNQNANSDVIKAEELTEELRDYLIKGFHEYTVNHEGLTSILSRCFRFPPLTSKLPIWNPFAYPLRYLNGLVKELKMPEGYRIVEKTPRNCFRVDFMHKLFPDAKFIFISREGKTNVSSLMEGWRRQAKQLVYNRFPKLNSGFEMSNFDFKKWEYVLPPGWENFQGASLEEVCAYQWAESNRHALNALDQLPANKVHKIKYEDLTANTAETIKGIAEFIDIPLEGKLKEYAERPPVVSTPQSDKPREDKWKKNEKALDKVAPMMEEMMQRLGYSEKPEKKETAKV